MTNKKNKGFSMVEILISLAIFMVLMVPIVSAIISSMKTTTSGKEMQYRNEFAQNILEYAKEDSIDNIINTSYFTGIGSYDVTATKDEKSITYRDDEGNSQSIPYEQYMIKGNMNLGTNHTKYTYAMEISNQYYAEKQKNDENFVNPNNLELGIVEDLDYTKLALINGTIANYDTAVSNAFMTRKLQILKTQDSKKFEQYVNQVDAINPFKNDKVERKIIVSVSGSKEDGYNVDCTLSYTDDSKYILENGTNLKDVLIDENLNEIKYNPYSTNFDELPNIYLMYNVCVYNGLFSMNDYIVCDTSGIEDDTPVNLFVVETASQYSDKITEVFTATKEDGTTLLIPETEEIKNLKKRINQTLYNDETKDGDTVRDNVNIYMAATKGSNLPNLNIYHNFDVGTTSTTNKKNQKFIYSGVGSLDTAKYKALVVKDIFNHVDKARSANVGPLNTAQEESRGLYQVKVWMQEGDTVDTSKDPIITGTKGGNES